MPDILIRGMEMPQCGERHIVICADGSVHDDGDSEIHWSAFQPTAKAVELPPHGDLIDRDALFKQMGVTDMDCYKCEFGNHGFCGRGEFSAACEAIEVAPVIVPASKGESE